MSSYDERLTFARQKAAQAWCTPETKCIEMDAILAKAFADILVVEMYSPKLGCATTKELIDELSTRIDFLQYRTIDDAD